MMPAQKIDQRGLADVCSRVKWHGRYFSCSCPFHDDNEPSLMVYEDGAFCMGQCQRQFSLYQVWAKVKNHRTFDVSSSTSSTRLINWRKLPPLEQVASDANEILLRYPSQRHYLLQRKLQDRIEPQHLGWWAGWITIPIFNSLYEFEGLIFRATPSIEQETNVRYMIPPEQEPMLYVPDWHRVLSAKKATRPIFVVFGIFDALALTELGLPVVTFTQGQKRSFSGADLLSVWRTRLIILPDKGEEQTAALLAAKLDWRGKVVELEYPEGIKDPAGFLQYDQKDSLLHQIARI